MIFSLVEFMLICFDFCALLWILKRSQQFLYTFLDFEKDHINFCALFWIFKKITPISVYFFEF